MLKDWRTAPVDDKLRAALAFVEVLTLRPDEVDNSYVAALREAGAETEAIECVVHVCAAFNIIDRIADALEFHVQTGAQFAGDAKMLLKHGYKM